MENGNFNCRYRKKIIVVDQGSVPEQAELNFKHAKTRMKWP